MMLKREPKEPSLRLVLTRKAASHRPRSKLYALLPEGDADVGPHLGAAWSRGGGGGGELVLKGWGVNSQVMPFVLVEPDRKLTRSPR